MHDSLAAWEQHGRSQHHTGECFPIVQAVCWHAARLPHAGQGTLIYCIYRATTTLHIGALQRTSSRRRSLTAVACRVLEGSVADST